MNKKIISVFLFICFLLSTNAVEAQKKFWVMFKNKNGTPYTTSNPGGFLTPKSVNRRVMYNTPVTASDLPVTPSYITQVDNVPNVTVLYASKWLNGVVVSIPLVNLNVAMYTISSFPFVASMAQVKKYALDLPKTQTVTPSVSQQAALRSSSTSSFNMGGSYTQNHQLNLECLHDIGYRGQGMTIAVLDVGFTNVDHNPVFDSLRNRSGILGTRDFVDGGTSVYEDPDHGAYVLSCMAAIQPGIIMGSAPRADYWLLRTEDGSSETISEEYNWIRGAEFADSVGADVLTTSLGYNIFDDPQQDHTYLTLDGKTAPMTIAATMAARKGMFVLNAAGNEGGGTWQYICVPADADSICTVGAVDSAGTYAFFSSTGPTADGRIKPDLVARGLGSWIAQTDGSICFPGNGTSFATPILAGAVACYWQAHRTTNNIQLLKALKFSATNNSNPNNQIGWGRPDLCLFVVGIKENALNALAADIIVSPNPFNALINIDLQQVRSEMIHIEVLDVLGKTVSTVNTSSKNLTLNTAEWNHGVYFIKIDTGSGTITKKIIRQ